MGDPDDPRPWVRFKDEIIKMIEAGVLEPGENVVVTEEAADFGICADTARKAFRALVAGGWLLPVPGCPYRVPPGPDCGRGRGNCHWPRCRLPNGSCDEARNCVN